MTTQRQLNILAERAHDNKKNLSEKDKQRRNQVVDLFGVDLSRNSQVKDGDNIATLYVSVSSDLVYYERFQFKIYIDDTTATDFQIIAVAKVEQQDGEYEEQEIDLTDYLTEQQDGNWIDGDNNGKAWPNNSDIVESSPDEPPNAYDILDVAGVMYATDDPETMAQADALLRPGFKKFLIKGNAPFFAAMILYLKYSHLNR